MSIKVSVVLPVHNVAPYLHECMDSVVNQTLKEIEIICVNDGSTDSSLGILKEYQKKDNRILIAQQDNQGAGVARNTGMDLAQGKYLSFLDPDDFFDPEMLERLFLRGEEMSAEVVLCDADVYDEKSKKTLENAIQYQSDSSLTDEIFSGRQYTFSNRDKVRNFIVPWRKLFLKEYLLAKKIRFQALYRNNDAYFGFVSFFLTDRIVKLSEILVHHRTNISTSSVSTYQLYPITSYHAMLAVKNRLLAEGVLEQIIDKVYSCVFDICFYFLFDVFLAKKHFPAFRELYEYIAENGEKDFQFHSVPASSYRDEVWDKYKKICSLTVEEYFYQEHKDSEATFTRFLSFLRNRETYHELCFFGAGKDAVDLLNYFRKLNLAPPVAICDNNVEKWGSEMEGIPVISFDNAREKYQDITIFISSGMYQRSILLEIQDFVLEENIVSLNTVIWETIRNTI